jgi:hypothetical protein
MRRASLTGGFVGRTLVLQVERPWGYGRKQMAFRIAKKTIGSTSTAAADANLLMDD